MNKVIFKSIIELSILALILSYFFIHNILLVLIGIFISLYLINISLIDGFRRSINEFLAHKKGSTKLEISDNANKADSTKYELKNKNPELTLVETIEYLGYIPSSNKK